MFNWIRRKPSASRIRPKHQLSIEGLEDRQMLSTVPIMGTLVDRTLPSGGPLYVPVISSSGDNSQVSYSVTSSDPNVTVIARQGYGYLDIAIAGFGPNGTDGHLIFQMFSDISPNSVATISTLVQQSFYTNLTLHRVAPNFVVQGGDPNGNGTGGPGFSYATETGDLSKFFGAGQLSLANQVQSGNPISNGSQFFVTFGPNPLFNGSFTLLGQMVRGFDVLDAIAKIPRISEDRPTNPPVITSATIVPNYTDTVLMIVTPEGYNANPTITVTATTSAGSSTQSFRVMAGDGGIDLQRIQFVNRAFSTILGRAAEQSAVDYYTNLLANNQVTTSQIGLEIQTSLEARMKTVTDVYKALLNRTPEAQTLASNTIFLMNGGSLAQLEANIVASQEFFESKGGTNAAWITAVFTTATGATSVPLSYSNQVSYQLDTGLKRSDYATTIFDSIASDVFTVQGQFKKFLERTNVTTADALPLAQQLNAGVSDDLIVATIVGSAEFFNFTKNQNAS